MNKSKLRYACFRAKNGSATQSHFDYIKQISSLIENKYEFDTFSLKWDIFITKDGEVKIFEPVYDYSKIHDICMEYSFNVKNGVKENLTEQASNVIKVIESLKIDEQTMPWDLYNKTWGVYVDLSIPKVNTKLFKTVKNVVSDDMIKKTMQSDGSSFTQPSLENINIDIDFPSNK